MNTLRTALVAGWTLLVVANGHAQGPSAIAKSRNVADYRARLDHAYDSAARSALRAGPTLAAQRAALVDKIDVARTSATVLGSKEFATQKRATSTPVQARPPEHLVQDWVRRSVDVTLASPSASRAVRATQLLHLASSKALTQADIRHIATRAESVTGKTPAMIRHLDSAPVHQLLASRMDLTKETAAHIRESADNARLWPETKEHIRWSLDLNASRRK